MARISTSPRGGIITITGVGIECGEHNSRPAPAVVQVDARSLRHSVHAGTETT
jgi:hypothetical protein